MKIYIDILSENNSVIKKEFCDEQLNIGSSANNDLIFENSDTVSPNHATILLKDDSFYIYSHSLFETFVDDKPVEISKLAQKAVIMLGIEGPRFIFNYSLSSNEFNKRRWYDTHPLVSKAIALLSKTDIEHTKSISSFLNSIFNIPMSNIELNQDSNNGNGDLQNLKRWYDSDNEIQLLIESFKDHAPEMQEKIAIDIIKFIDCMNQQEVAL